MDRVLDALGVEFGATHTEIVLGDAGPRVIETHIRMGGDEIPALAFDATDVDLADCVVRQTVGEKVLPEIRAVLAKNGPPAARRSGLSPCRPLGCSQMSAVFTRLAKPRGSMRSDCWSSPVAPSATWSPRIRESHTCAQWILRPSRRWTLPEKPRHTSSSSYGCDASEKTV